MPDQTQASIAPVARSTGAIEHIVVMKRLHRYNHGRPYGAGALHRELQKEGIYPLPSVRRISQILRQYGMTHGRTGWYEGDELDWLAPSARVPEARRKYFSMTDYRCL